MTNISTKQLAYFAVSELESGSSVSSISNKLAGFLLQERRTRDAIALFRAIEKELSDRGSDQIVITGAYSLPESVKQRLAKVLGAKNPVFTGVIEQNVVGGVKARMGEKQVDLTIRDRLDRFKKRVINSSNQEIK